MPSRLIACCKHGQFSVQFSTFLCFFGRRFPFKAAPSTALKCVQWPLAQGGWTCLTEKPPVSEDHTVHVSYRAAQRVQRS